MKVNYDAILESYSKANQELLDEYVEIATEANAVNTTGNRNSITNSAQNPTKDITSDTSNELSPTSKFKSNFIQRFKDMIKKIIERVQNASVKIMNRLKLMLESDKAFQHTLHQRRAAIQPLKNFKAITYNYNDQYLETTINGLQKLSIMSIKQLSNFTGSASDSKVKQIIESDPSSVSNVLLSFFSKENPDGGIDTQAFIREMIDTFRGPKKEQMWSQSSIPQLMIIAKGTSTLSSKCNDIINECKNSVNVLKALEAKARMQNTTEGILNISRRVTKATAIYNSLLAISRMYFELKLEEALSARILLKKFYQF